MTRLPRVDSACRFFPEIPLLHRRTGAPCAGRDRDRAGPDAFLHAARWRRMPPRDRPITSRPSPRRSTAPSIQANTATSNDWPTFGLDYAETRFSKLNQINADNVKKLGLVWSYNLESTRGVEATPLVVDGIMYRHRVVERGARDRRAHRQAALDLRSRRSTREKGYKGCCDVVNRGVALYKGKVFVGAYDGRLIALDAATGKKVWEKDTHHRPASVPTPSPARRACSRAR